MTLGAAPQAGVGNPLYDVSADHAIALVALVAVGIGAWRVRTRLAELAPADALLVVLLAASAAVHAALAIGHDAGGAARLLFAVDAALLATVARRVLGGAPAGRIGGLLLAASIVAYWIAVFREPPDQLGVATKLAEVVAFAIVVRPSADARRLPAAARSTAVVLLVIGTALTSWIGAFRAAASEPGAVAGHHVHAGDIAPPGTVLPAHVDRDPTPAERAAAEQLVSETRLALARYADPALAAADGYRVEGVHGIDFHADNPRYEHDGRILDPAHPETLVYAVAPDGRPILMGALFKMPDIGASGPAIGGPLTMWHAHEQVCVSLTPPSLTGLLSPLGGCPIGSIDLPLTGEMIHIWIVPGAPQPFGDLDEAWKRAYLAGLGAR